MCLFVYFEVCWGVKRKKTETKNFVSWGCFELEAWSLVEDADLAICRRLLRYLCSGRLLYFWSDQTVHSQRVNRHIHTYSWEILLGCLHLLCYAWKATEYGWFCCQKVLQRISHVEGKRHFESPVMDLTIYQRELALYKSTLSVSCRQTYTPSHNLQNELTKLVV